LFELGLILFRDFDGLDRRRVGEEAQRAALCAPSIRVHWRVGRLLLTAWGMRIDYSSNRLNQCARELGLSPSLLMHCRRLAQWKRRDVDDAVKAGLPFRAAVALLVFDTLAALAARRKRPRAKKALIKMRQELVKQYAAGRWSPAEFRRRIQAAKKMAATMR
jgi:hypothetical protein